MRVTCRRCKHLLLVNKTATGVIEIKCESCKLVAEYALAAIMATV